MKLSEADQILMRGLGVSVDELPDYHSPVSKDPAPRKPLNYDRLLADVLADDDDPVFDNFARVLTTYEIENEELRAQHQALLNVFSARNAVLRLEYERLQKMSLWLLGASIGLAIVAVLGWAR